MRKKYIRRRRSRARRTGPHATESARGLEDAPSAVGDARGVRARRLDLQRLHRRDAAEGRHHAVAATSGRAATRPRSAPVARRREGGG